MPLETIQLFLSNVFFLLLVQLYVRCSRLYHSRKSMAITFGLVIHPHQSVRVELYYCNNNFTKRAGLLNRSMYICESTGVHIYVRDYPYSSDSFDTIAGENIACSFDFATDSNVSGFKFETRNSFECPLPLCQALFHTERPSVTI